MKLCVVLKPREHECGPPRSLTTYRGRLTKLGAYHTNHSYSLTDLSLIVAPIVLFRSFILNHVLGLYLSIRRD